jgi:hypothetical protein
VRGILLAVICILVSIIFLGIFLNLQFGEGIIQGKVSIGPWTPVETPGIGYPPPEVFTSRKIILEGSFFDKVVIPMNGTGYFHASVKAGIYKLTMTNCTFLGCSNVLPKIVTINKGEITIIDIDIDTGIR